jgi:hypothetical protein
MNDLKWLDKYSGQSTDELIALEGKYRTDSLVLAFEQAIDRKSARVGAENLTDEERVILAIEALEREVNNGGYDQFFTNSSNVIGCTEAAMLTQDAINALGIRGVITVEAIARMMFEKKNAELAEKLDDCTKRFYKIAGDLSSPLLAFIKNNTDKINLEDQS